MKNHNPIHVTSLPGLTPVSYEPAEDEVRDYAFHLYQQSGCTAGRDLDNWLEATACLKANVAAGSSQSSQPEQAPLATVTSRAV